MNPPKKMKTGSYAATTKVNLQGPSNNGTAQDIRMLTDGSGRENIAVRKTMKVGNTSYEQFLAERKTPAGQKQKAEYERKNGLGSLQDRDYAARVYESSKADLQKRARANPETLVSKEAINAATQASRQRSMENGDYASMEAGQMATDASQKQFYAAQRNDGTAKVVPGATSMQPVKMKPAKGAEKKIVGTYKNGTKKMKVKKG